MVLVLPSIEDVDQEITLEGHVPIPEGHVPSLRVMVAQNPPKLVINQEVDATDTTTLAQKVRKSLIVLVQLLQNSVGDVDVLH